MEVRERNGVLKALHRNTKVSLIIVLCSMKISYYVFFKGFIKSRTYGDENNINDIFFQRLFSKYYLTEALFFQTAYLTPM